MQRYLAAVLLSGAAAFVPSRPCMSQAADCTYDRCALRFQYRLFSSQLVQGREANPVAISGIFRSRVRLLETASDSVRYHYETFRRNRQIGGGFDLAGLTALLVAGAVYAADTYKNGDAARGLLVVGLSLEFVGGIHDARAANSMERAIWHYNRLLPR